MGVEPRHTGSQWEGTRVRRPWRACWAYVWLPMVVLAGAAVAYGVQREVQGRDEVGR